MKLNSDNRARPSGDGAAWRTCVLKTWGPGTEADEKRSEVPKKEHRLVSAGIAPSFA